jgi:hypothetical protein
MASTPLTDFLLYDIRPDMESAADNLPWDMLPQNHSPAATLSPISPYDMDAMIEPWAGLAAQPAHLPASRSAKERILPALSPLSRHSRSSPTSSISSAASENASSVSSLGTPPTVPASPTFSECSDDLEHHAFPSAPPPAKRRCIKTSRSSSIDDEANRPRKSGTRIAHKLVEKKYRDSLNSAFEKLQAVFPRPGEDVNDYQDKDNSNTDAPKSDHMRQTKVATLLQARSYIRQLQAENERLQTQVSSLKDMAAQDRALWEKLAFRGAVTRDLNMSYARDMTWNRR